MKESKVIVPPIKCQGIKTKLVPKIKENLNWDENNGVWIEPFVGSGVVVFNVQPQKAILADMNKHIISFYQSVQCGEIDEHIARTFLEDFGRKLSHYGEDFYYEVRDKFNETGNPLYFLFLSRSCFNGVMRFNRKGFFNVPFCKKSDRFSKAYVTKICNQIEKIRKVMIGKEWQFIHQDWRETMNMANKGDFIYLDPPYIGRDTGYVGEWSEEDARELSLFAVNSMANIMLSMWKENKYRSNTHLNECWSEFEMIELEHFYHVGATENLRNKMVEVLVIKESVRKSL